MPTAQREEPGGVKLAERRLAEFRRQVASLTASPEERRPPFSALAKRCLRIHNVHLKPSSADRNVRCVKDLNKTFGKLAVSEITTRHCEGWMASRQRLKQGGRSDIDRPIARHPPPSGFSNLSRKNL